MKITDTAIFDSIIIRNKDYFLLKQESDFLKERIKIAMIECLGEDAEKIIDIYESDIKKLAEFKIIKAYVHGYKCGKK